MIHHDDENDMDKKKMIKITIKIMTMIAMMMMMMMMMMMTTLLHDENDYDDHAVGTIRTNFMKYTFRSTRKIKISPLLTLSDRHISQLVMYPDSPG
jgi:flagellar basal body-associated protein FliL